MPKAMLAATPPRRTTRSSTRNDSDTLCSWSASSWSAKRPGKCIRWSVAIEPVTAIFMRVGPRMSAYGRQMHGQRTGDTDANTTARAGRPERPIGCAALSAAGGDSVERVAAGAGALRVGVVDREALRVDAVDEVDRGAGQVRRAHPVDDDLDAAEVRTTVAVERRARRRTAGSAGRSSRPAARRRAARRSSRPSWSSSAFDLHGGGVGEDDAGRWPRSVSGSSRSSAPCDGRRTAPRGRAVVRLHVRGPQSTPTAGRVPGRPMVTPGTARWPSAAGRPCASVSTGRARASRAATLGQRPQALGRVGPAPPRPTRSARPASTTRVTPAASAPRAGRPDPAGQHDAGHAAVAGRARRRRRRPCRAATGRRTLPSPVITRSAAVQRARPGRSAARTRPMPDSHRPPSARSAAPSPPAAPAAGQRGQPRRAARQVALEHRGEASPARRRAAARPRGVGALLRAEDRATRRSRPVSGVSTSVAATSSTPRSRGAPPSAGAADAARRRRSGSA